MERVIEKLRLRLLKLYLYYQYEWNMFENLFIYDAIFYEMSYKANVWNMKYNGKIKKGNS